LLDELQQGLAKQEDTIRAQQEVSENDKQFRQRHDEEFKPMIVTLYTDMFTSTGWTSDEASEMAQEKYGAMCALGQG
jgi:hypothetical protein